MSVGVASARSQQCLKRLLDENQEDLPKCKRVRVAPPPPSTDLTPCLRPQSPAPKSSCSQSLSTVGPYVLYERYEGEEAYRAEHTHTQQQYTCKVLPMRGYQEQLAAYTRLGHHDNISKLRDVVIGEDNVYIFLAGHHGDMHSYVRSKKRLSEEEAGLLFTQMLEAVTHCHRHGVVLRDVKLRRFVFTDKHRARLVLLGLDDCVLLSGNHNNDSLTDRHGCPAYVGPELLTNGSASYSGRAADIWSLGVSLYTMLIGRYPFQDTQPAALFAKIRRGAFTLPDWLSPQAKCLIGCMLRKLPAERLEAEQLLMHPWLTNPCAPHHKSVSAGRVEQDDDQVVPTWTDMNT